jgi:hypothetical protein
MKRRNGAKSFVRPISRRSDRARIRRLTSIISDINGICCASYCPLLETLIGSYGRQTVSFVRSAPAAIDISSLRSRTRSASRFFRARGTNFLELVEVLAKHYVAIGVSVPEVVPDGTGNLAKCWSEWQDLNLRPPRPERGGARH